MTKVAPVLKYRRPRRRRKRERYIEELERGRRYRLDFFDQDGKRRRETVIGTLTDARNRRIEILAAVKRGTYRTLADRRREQKQRSMTFAEFGARSLRDYTGRNGKPRSGYYKQNIETLTRALGHRRTVDLGQTDLDILKAKLEDPQFWLRKRRPKRSTVRKVWTFAVCRSICGAATSRRRSGTRISPRNTCRMRWPRSTKSSQTVTLATPPVSMGPKSRGQTPAKVLTANACACSSVG